MAAGAALGTSGCTALAEGCLGVWVGSGCDAVGGNGEIYNIGLPYVASDASASKPGARLPGQSTTTLDRIFKISLALKGLDGVLELVGGLLLLPVSPAEMVSVVHFLTQHDLSEDPRDLVSTSLVHWAGP